jgi:hypothetical protein
MYASYEEEEIYNSRSKQIEELKSSLDSNPDSWTSCSESEIKIGDIISVYYMVDSQKYLYVHLPEFGTVQKVEQVEYYCPTSDSYKQEYSITILNSDGKLVLTNKEHLSMYSRGYYMCIEKYTKK